METLFVLVTLGLIAFLGYHLIVGLKDIQQDKLRRQQEILAEKDAVKRLNAAYANFGNPASAIRAHIRELAPKLHPELEEYLTRILIHNVGKPYGIIVPTHKGAVYSWTDLQDLERQIALFTNPKVKQAWTKLVDETVRAYLVQIPRAAVNYDDSDKTGIPIDMEIKIEADRFLSSVSDEFRIMSELTGVKELYEQIRDARFGYSKGTPIFFAGTPFFPLSIPKQFVAYIPLQTRFEHHWICARTGHGKTHTLDHLLSMEIEPILKGERSAILIDSQGKMIERITQLEMWKKWPDRLVWINPKDVQFPLALNLFDIGQSRAQKQSPEHRERAENNVIEIYEYLLGDILDTKLTTKQGTPFNAIIRLMAGIKGATVQDFLNIFEHGIGTEYQYAVDALPPHMQPFFAPDGQFNDPQYKETKREIVRRIWDIIINPTIGRMFTAKQNKLNLLKEMNEGKLILIDTARNHLGRDRSKLFGRFFLAMIAQATQERGQADIPCFVYIDECHEYLDKNMTELIVQARQHKVGIIVAHRHLGELSEGVYDALAANSAIIMVGDLQHPQDAATFAKIMKRDQKDFGALPKLHFAAYVHGLTPPPGIWEAAPDVFGTTWAPLKMGPRDYADLIIYQRRKYSIDPDDNAPEPPPEPPLKSTLKSPKSKMETDPKDYPRSRPS